LALEVDGAVITTKAGGHTMKCALLVDHDPVNREHAAGLLKSLGYLVASTDNTQTALHTAQTVRVDVILTDTAFNTHDRRSFVGELGRLAPAAPVVLMTEAKAVIPIYHDGCSAVLTKPVGLRPLRRVIEFGIDGDGTLPLHTGCDQERRRRSDRRHRSR
jgi:CheY-like chemotaxis protein